MQTTVGIAFLDASLAGYDKYASTVCVFTVVRDAGVVYCACFDRCRSALIVSFSTSALLFSRRRVQPHHFNDIFSMKVWMQPQYVLQWMAILWPIKQVATSIMVFAYCDQFWLGAVTNVMDFVMSDGTDRNFLLFPRMSDLHSWSDLHLQTWSDLQPTAPKRCRFVKVET